MVIGYIVISLCRKFTPATTLLLPRKKPKIIYRGRARPCVHHLKRAGEIFFIDYRCPAIITIIIIR